MTSALVYRTPIDAAGTLVVEYMYDVWGAPTAKTGTLAATRGQLCARMMGVAGICWRAERTAKCTSILMLEGVKT